LVATNAQRHKKPNPFSIAVLLRYPASPEAGFPAALSCFSRSWILPYPHLITKWLYQIKRRMDGLGL